jgi:uncharacterized protein YchJ
VCLSGDQYAQCCGRFHSGGAEAATAEQLMRSRYSAFALLDAGYLRRTWHPDTAPAALDLDPDMLWRRLDILSTTGGGPFQVRPRQRPLVLCGWRRPFILTVAPSAATRRSRCPG